MNMTHSAVDKAAIGLSLLCTVHCLLLPLVAATLPVLAGTPLDDERFHQWLLIAVLPTSLIALTMGCRRHGNGHVIAIGLLGLTILALTAFFGHDVIGETGEKTATLAGASLIAIGHIRNYSLCNKLKCH